MDKMYLSIPEAAKVMHCCIKTVRTRIKERKLKAHQPDRKWLITPAAIREYVEAQDEE